MKNIHEVLTQKIAELKRCQAEVRALYAALPLLAEQSDLKDIQELLDEKESGPDQGNPLSDRITLCKGTVSQNLMDEKGDS